MTTENNKIIAIKDKQILLDFINSDAEVLSLNIDFNFLMQVVEKIFSEECIKPLSGNGMYYVLELFIEEALKKAKKEAVYNACLEFINWYNKQK